MANTPLTHEQLAAYLARIGHDGAVAPDVATLRALHAAHIGAIAFENLDTQFGTPPVFGADGFDKLVTRRRGGWCYEQNGLFARALAAIGFEVTPLACAVMRELRGDHTMGAHLALKVRAGGQDWLADVGFGSAMLAPLPLAEGRDESGPIPVSLALTDDGYWRLTTHSPLNPMSFDFHDRPAQDADLARMCAWQGSDPGSIFVQNALARRLTADAHRALLGRNFQVTTRAGVEQRTVEDAEEYVSLLRVEFGLDIPEAAKLWPAICARHQELFGEQAA